MDARARLLEIKQSWKPPAELERCRPRELRITNEGRALRLFSLFLVIGALVAWVLLSLKATNDHQDRRLIVERGLDIQAEVIRCGKTSGRDGHYWVLYAYHAEGRELSGRLRIGKRGWGGLSEGSLLPVRYLPSRPQLHYVVGREGDLMPLWVPYLAAAGILAVAWFSLLPLASQRRLLAEGRAAPAVVTHHQKTKDGKVAHYAFLLMSGATANGKTGPHKKPPEVGEVICVLYEPDRIRNNRTYPLSLVRSVHAPAPASAARSKALIGAGSPLFRKIRAR